MRLDDEIALVTGASRGIGRAIALGLAAQGATVIGTATSESGASAISDALRQAGARGEGRAVDVTDDEGVTALFKSVSEAWGAPTVLVNNAAITRDNLMLRMKAEEWSAVLDANLSGVYRTSKAVLRGMMKAKRGRIINITSVVGQTGNAGQINYAAAKAGVLGLTKSLAREVASRGITVNAVAPGFIDTDMTRSLGDATRETLLSEVPLGRLGEPEDVAAAVAFLASPAAGYITGETLNVNGGLYMG